MHIAGVDNGLADDLSGNKLELINEKAAKLNDNPSPIPFFFKWLILELDSVVQFFCCKGIAEPIQWI